MDLNDTTNRVIAVIVLLLIFIGGWWLIARNAVSSKVVADKGAMTDDSGKKSDVTTDTSSAKGDSMKEESKSMTATTEMVSVLDQPAGNSVTVSSATLAQDGWLAVRDSEGRVLGAARLDAGTASDVMVELLRATEAGQHYQVLVYVDDGDKEFDLKKDTLVMKADGSVAGASFSTL